MDQMVKRIKGNRCGNRSNLKTSCIFSEYERARSLSFGGDSAEKPPFADDGTYQGGEKM